MSASIEVLRGRRVIGIGDVTGTIVQTQLVDTRPYVHIALQDGHRVLVPYDLLVAQADGSYLLPVSNEDLVRFAATDRSEDASIVVPVIAEELVVEKRTVERGRVRIHKRVETHEERVDEELLREEVEVERVPVHQVVQTPPEVRFEGETMIIPLLEEVLVIEKRLMVREELRVTRRKTTFHQPQTVMVRRERADVERLPRAPATESPTTDAAQSSNAAHEVAGEL